MAQLAFAVSKFHPKNTFPTTSDDTTLKGQVRLLSLLSCESTFWWWTFFESQWDVKAYIFRCFFMQITWGFRWPQNLCFFQLVFGGSWYKISSKICVAQKVFGPKWQKVSTTFTAVPRQFDPSTIAWYCSESCLPIPLKTKLKKTMFTSSQTKKQKHDETHRCCPQ